VNCTLCGGALELVATMAGVPIFCNVLLDTAEGARQAPRGDIELGVCTSCAAGTNLAFDPRAVPYQDGYENSLHCSPTFQAYAEGLARELVVEHALAGAVVLEIGAGRGEFLSLLCRAGGPGTSGIGVDPSLPAAEEHLGPVHLRRGLFPATGGDVEVDAVVCRHVLEHVDDPAALAAAMARTRRARPTLPVYVEVPDGAYMLRTGAVWDLLYEHAWYFSAPALRRLFASRGLDVRRVGTSFGDQYLWIEATAPTTPIAAPVSVGDRDAEVGEILVAARSFGGVVDRCRQSWADALTQHRRAGERVAVWGIGTKGTTFLNWVPGADDVAAVVDVNPRKHGRFVPGTGHRVVGPEDLVAAPPDVVLVMNPMYEREIRGTLDRLGLDATDVIVVTADAAAPRRRAASPA
jgi:hypothetical protein